MSELALRLIEENKKTRAPFLDLGNCGLTEVPAEIGELMWLEALSFAQWVFDEGKSGNLGPVNKIRRLTPSVSPISALKRLWSGAAEPNPWPRLIHLKRLWLTGFLDEVHDLADLSPLSCLVNLQVLGVSRTEVADLSPLSGLVNLQALDVHRTKVADLKPLAGLANLLSLDISGTAAADLFPLTGLGKLQTLDVAHTSVADLSPLAGLRTLSQLNVAGTGVMELSPLSTLPGLSALNVSDTAVKNLEPLAGLTGLESVDVSNTEVDDLAALAGMEALRSLNVSNTPVADLAPLFGLAALRTLKVANTGVEDLAPLSVLAELGTLDLSRTEVRNLDPLARLVRLWVLDVSNTKVVDLSPLARLPGLFALYVRKSGITDLSPLSGLTELSTLDLSNTGVTDLSPLSGLKLKRLNLSQTAIADLSPLLPAMEAGIPVKWSSEFWREEGIYVEDCPFTHPPAEVIKQGNAAILNYFRETRTQGVDRLYEAKLLIVGEGGAGKTSLLRRLYRPAEPLPEECDTTRGIDIYRHEFPLPNGRTFRLNVWDFGGQEIYHATHQFFLTKRSLYVLLDDTRKDYKTVQDEGFKYWLEAVDQLSDHSPVLIFQNEKGGRGKTIDEAGIKARFNVKDVYRGNLEYPGAADSLREALAFHAAHLRHIGDELPARWVDIRAGIEALAREVPHIPQQEYFDLYARHLPFDREKALLLSRYFHDLGAFLHFQDDPLLARTVILQNEWATEAVFRMLDDEEVKAKLGRFTAADGARVWRDSVYADMHPELLALMQNFELCYRLPDTRPETWLAPQLLPPSKPAQLAGWEQAGDLVLRYRYEFLPKGMISRLMVRQHRFVPRPDLGWVTGVLFGRDGTELLAEIPPRGGEIVLRARGPERKELLSVIAADLDALNGSFHGLREKVEKLVPCNCKKCSALAEPNFFEHRLLSQFRKDGVRTWKCSRSYEDVDVLEMLDGIRVDRLPGWVGEETAAGSPSTSTTFKIFLASSAELREDRDALELFFRQQNDRLREKGIYLKIVRWENSLDAMAETRLQDEYNKEVRACDIFVSLFFRKTGKFTEEEFDTAHRQFQATGKPLIYTFFKNAPVGMGEIGEEVLSLLQFKKKLADLGHFVTGYDNTEHLKRQFRDQLDKLAESGALAGETGPSTR